MTKMWTTQPSTLTEKLFYHTWWLILCGILFLLIFEQGEKHRKAYYMELSQKLQDLEKELEKARRENQDLLLQIHSQSDPAFVELTLMKILGVIPEGQLKVFFSYDVLKQRKANTTSHGSFHGKQ